MNWPQTVVIAALGAVVAVSIALSMGAGRSGDPATAAPAQPAERPKPAAMPGATDPAAMEWLKAGAGIWDAQITFWFRPGMDPVHTKAICTAEMDLDGMFLRQRFEGGDFGPVRPGATWTSVSYTGFNPSTKQYEAVRMASTNSTMIVVRGKLDGAGKVLTLSGEYQMAGMASTHRDVITQISADERRVESFMKFGDTPEFKGAEMILTRRK